jgi:Kef-type K+ transport system membrane component KefB
VTDSPIFLSLVTILATSQVLARLLRRLGQPPVVGEIIAGFVLGPIVLGALWPDTHARLFSHSVSAGLSAIASLGVVLFTFAVGVEVRQSKDAPLQWNGAACVGLCSVLVPFSLGVAIAPVVYPTMAPTTAGHWPFALFLGTALSVTALPVLARIVKDRGMAGTKVGQLALGAAAAADVLSWGLLLVVVSIAGANNAPGRLGLGHALAGLATLCLVLACVVRPIVAGTLKSQAPGEYPSLPFMAGLLIGLFVCAEVTEWLGLHRVFGAFLFGVALPQDERLARAVSRSVEPLAIVVLMPVFFALAGLSTTPDAFASHSMLLLVLLLSVAIASKLAVGVVGARLVGLGWRDSLTVGTLLNARGLMEIVVIKVGLDAGLIRGELFTILLFMAVATTAMTGPLIAWLREKQIPIAQRG